MSKVRGPLLSLRARGQIGQSIVFSDWKGVSYTRQYVVPENPRTAGQTETRSTFAWLVEYYRHAGPLAAAPWALATVGRPLTPANLLIRTNLPPLRQAGTLQDFVYSAGARGGPAPAGFTATTGVGPGRVNITITPPVLPTGWIVAYASFALIRDQNPHDPFVHDSAEGQDQTGPDYAMTLQIQAINMPALAGAWIVYERPDATLAMSVSAQQIVTTGS